MEGCVEDRGRGEENAIEDGYEARAKHWFAQGTCAPIILGHSILLYVRSQEDNPLILCLIDGDGNIFSQDLLRLGLAGGRHAAALLTKGLNDHLANIDSPDAGRGQLWLTIYFNKTGLLETLTQWSRKNATETQVSDVYVRLGYEFNIACRAFASINVDVSDLGNVPDQLRQILEETLSQEASQKSLDIYLPKIRDIIINLLHGLKRKQAKLRAKQKENQSLPSRAVSGVSMESTSTAASGLTQMLEEVPNHYPSNYRSASPSRRTTQTQDPRIPARSSSAQGAREEQYQSHPGHQQPQHAQSNSRDGVPQRQISSRDSVLPAETDKRFQRDAKAAGQSVSSMSSDTMQGMPVISPTDNRKLPTASFVDGTGYARLANGETWTARLDDRHEHEAVGAGARLTVVGIEGATAVVAPVPAPTPGTGATP